MSRKPFQFKQFNIYDDKCAMKVGTDGVLLGAWANIDEVETILDIGTGTGLIAIMLAQRTMGRATIHGVEIDAHAVEQANENIKNCPWSDCLELYHTPIQDFNSSSINLYDLIVSNPPYFLSGSKSSQSNRNKARHTETLSHIELLKAVARLLSENGEFSLILPRDEGNQFIEEALSFGLFPKRVLEVKPKVDKPVERQLITLSKNQTKPEVDSLIIQYEKRNHFTPQYIELTKGFYTIM